MKKVTEFAQRFEMLPRYELLLVAASGGMDSMCLLHYLYTNGYRIAAAHFNHRLRGEESDADEELVRMWCAARRIAFCVGTGNVKAAAEQNGWTLEEAARRLRYDFLNNMAEQTGAVRILTAHHADDNAETMLFHLARGTGITGLSGIAPVRGKIARPFLCLTRAELADYAKRERVPYRTDATNADTAFSRNFIRAELLPKMVQLNPQAVEHMSETAQRLRQEDEYLDALAAERLGALECSDEGVTLPCAALCAAPEVLRTRMLRQMLDGCGAGKKDFTAAHYASLAALCESAGEGQLSLPNGIVARRKGGKLTLCRAAANVTERTTLRENETIFWGDYTISCKKVKKNVQNCQDTLFLSYGKIANVSVGTWDSHARMTLKDRPRSLKRLFTERGIAPEARERTPVIYVDDETAAVYGIGVDKKFCAEDDATALAIEIRRTEKS